MQLVIEYPTGTGITHTPDVSWAYVGTTVLLDTTSDGVIVNHERDSALVHLVFPPEVVAAIGVISGEFPVSRDVVHDDLLTLFACRRIQEELDALPGVSRVYIIINVNLARSVQARHPHYTSTVRYKRAKADSEVHVELAGMIGVTDTSFSASMC